jgi:hypothetical protein
MDWLHADLANWTKVADDAKQHAHIRQTPQRWQKDADFAGIRVADSSPSCWLRTKRRARNCGPTWRTC